MKHCFTTLLAAAGLFGSFAAQAAVPYHVTYGEQKSVSLNHGEEFRYLNFMEPSTPDVKKAPQKVKGTNKVTINFDFDDTLFSADMFVSLEWTSGHDMQFLMPGETSVEFTQIPSEDALLMCSFRNKGVPHMPGSYYIFKEFTVNGDETLTVKPSDATQLIKFSSVMPDGEAPVLPSIATAEDINGEKDWDGANCRNIGAYTQVYSKKWGGQITGGQNSLSFSRDGMSGPENFWVCITPVDETWHFSQTRWMEDLNNNIYATHSACTVATEPAVNAPEFTEYTYDFAVNPILELVPSGEDAYTQGYAIQYMANGSIDTFNFVFYGKETYKYFLSKPKPCDTPWRTTNYGVQVYNVEYDIDKDFGWGSTPDMRSVISPIGMYNEADNGITLLNNSTIEDGSPLWWTLESSEPVVLPTTDALKLDNSSRLYSFGATAPVCVATILNRSDDEEYMELSAAISYLGIYGDVRGADNALSTVFLKSGDVDETVNLADFDNLFYDLGDEGELSGEVSIEVANDQNIVFDGIEGYNFLNLTIKDINGSDVTPPTTTAYQLRNVAGEVCNQFEKAADGLFYLTGGDYTPEEGYFTVAEPATLKLECAPEGSETYEEIPLEVIPENFCMPNMGYFWQGSLEGVKAYSEDGWYKVRLTLIDEAGNVSQQTFYPAFRINENSGVRSVASDNSDAPVRYFNMQGMEVKNPVNGEILIRRQGNTSSKILVK